MKKTTQLIRHIVLFKFKETTNPNDIQIIETAFEKLYQEIPLLESFEWGLNNSPEGLEKGFTHCFLLSFSSNDNRNDYLVHPKHEVFKAFVTPFIEDVLVFDYASFLLNK